MKHRKISIIIITMLLLSFTSPLILNASSTTYKDVYINKTNGGAVMYVTNLGYIGEVGQTSSMVMDITRSIQWSAVLSFYCFPDSEYYVDGYYIDGKFYGNHYEMGTYNFTVSVTWTWTAPVNVTVSFSQTEPSEPTPNPENNLRYLHIDYDPTTTYMIRVIDTNNNNGYEYMDGFSNRDFVFITGHQLSIYVIPLSGYKFVNWNNNMFNTANPRIAIFTENTTYAPVMEIDDSTPTPTGTDTGIIDSQTFYLVGLMMVLSVLGSLIALITAKKGEGLNV